MSLESTSKALNFSNFGQLSDTEKKVYRDWIYELLKSEVVDLTFVKKDGTIREMKCTLMESKLPPKKETNYIPAENVNSLPVFDLEKNEWRAFRYDSVTNIQFSIGAE